jgi:hypothetical protein
MSTVKVNTVDKRTGGTLTLGGCGTTVTLGAGATQSGFGRTGTVDWCTTAKTSPFTGVSGNGYFVNTTCGAVTVTLPATPSAGDIISIADYASTWQTNAVTICRNSSKINGICNNASLSTEGQSITLVYVDATRGWKNTMDSTSNVSGAPNYIIATGGTITCCGDYKIHTFTSDSTFIVSNAGNPAGSTTVDYLVVAGGGAGARDSGGGGGAGGLRIGAVTPSPSHSPLVTTSLPVSVTTYPITVGAGGASNCTPCCTGGSGTNSIFSTITSAGGGGASFDATAAASGGSGGGAGPGAVGSGNTPPVSPPQGSNGASRTAGVAGGGGGGGTTAAGSNGGTSCQGGAGGNGLNVSPVFGASPKPYYAADVPTAGPTSTGIFAGGGGGGPRGPAFAPGHVAQGGDGGGGDGRENGTESGYQGVTNSGGGGGAGPGGASPQVGGSGGSGVVIVRYKFQN